MFEFGSELGCSEYHFKDIAAEAAWSADVDRSTWAISVGCSREDFGMASAEATDDTESTPVSVAASAELSQAATAAERDQAQPMWHQTMTHPVASGARRQLLAARLPVGQQQPGALRVWLTELAATASAWWRSGGFFSRASWVCTAQQDLTMSFVCMGGFVSCKVTFGAEDCQYRSAPRVQDNGDDTSFLPAVPLYAPPDASFPAAAAEIRQIRADAGAGQARQVEGVAYPVGVDVGGGSDADERAFLAVPELGQPAQVHTLEALPLKLINNNQNTASFLFDKLMHACLFFPA